MTAIQNEPGATLQERVTEVGQALAHSFAELLNAVPGAPHQPQRLARKLGINKDLSSRILMIARTQDPIAVAHSIPGPGPLRRLIRAAAPSVPASLIQEAERAVEEFETLINHQTGDRSALDAAIADWLPDVRTKAELLSKQAAFRGMRHLKGVEAAVLLDAEFIHPSADGVHIDQVSLCGLVGLRRLRPLAPVKLTAGTINKRPPGFVFSDLDGVPVADAASCKRLLLREFCTSRSAGVECYEGEREIQMLLTDPALGLSNVVDHYVGNMMQHIGTIRDPSRRRPPAAVSAVVTHPSRVLVYDLFLADEVCPGEPSLRIYDTSVLGLASHWDNSRDADLYQTAETLLPLGRGFAGCRVAEVSRYPDMLYHVCQRRGWNPESFRGYRVRIEYPIYGSQVCGVFDLPQD